MAKAPGTTLTVVKILDDIELHLLYWHENHLSDALAGPNVVSFRAAIPAGNEHLALVVRIDEAGQVAKDESVFVAQAGTRQQYGGQPGIRNMNREPRRHQHRLARRHAQGIVNNGSHVEAGGAIGRIVWQWDGIADSRIQNLQLN